MRAPTMRALLFAPSRASPPTSKPRRSCARRSRTWEGQERVARLEELHDLRWGKLCLRLLLRRLHIAQHFDERALTSLGVEEGGTAGGGGGEKTRDH